jgi:hypothetical protein
LTVYEGKPVTLPPQSEEVAGFFAALLETDYAVDDKFVKNFFTDFEKVPKTTLPYVCQPDISIETPAHPLSRLEVSRLRSLRSVTSVPCSNTLKQRRRRRKL